MIQKLLNGVRVLLPWTTHVAKYFKYTWYYEYFLIVTAKSRHEAAYKKIAAQPTIKIIFFAFNRSIWKYDLLYKLFEQSSRFDPIIVVCPFTAGCDEIMISEMTSTYKYLSEKGFNVVSAWNSLLEKWIDVKKEFSPGIIFFTDPHKLTRNEYYINHFVNYLTCYLPYTFQISNLYEVQYNQLFHNLTWKIFSPTLFHHEIARRFARNKGRNIEVTGYAGTDILQQGNYIPKDTWKIKDRKIKRIIWAPHHTIDHDTSFLAYSNFVRYHRFMLDVAARYADKIQIAFKPHPLLRSKLYAEHDWGKEKTCAYYKTWETMPNGQLEESDYADLFMTSDAMIHDSSSFMAEYLAVNKPVLYTIRDQNIKDRFNDLGKMAFERHYHAKTGDEIIRFIVEVILKGRDIKKKQREAFFFSYIKPPNNMLAADNIFNSIADKFKTHKFPNGK